MLDDGHHAGDESVEVLRLLRRVQRQGERLNTRYGTLRLLSISAPMLELVQLFQHYGFPATVVPCCVCCSEGFRWWWRWTAAAAVGRRAKLMCS